MSETPAYPHTDLTHQIIGAFYDVYNAIGSGAPEHVYRRALGIALADAGLNADWEVPRAVRYRGKPVGRFRADLIVEGKIVLELKARHELTRGHQVQLLNLLRATKLEVGLLLNFGPRPEVKRLILSRGRRFPKTRAGD